MTTNADEAEETLAQSEDRTSWKLLLAQWGGPAFVMREANVRLAWEHIAARCQRQRDDWLEIVRLRVGMLLALAGDWDALADCLGADQIALLQQFHADLKPRLRIKISPTTSAHALRCAAEVLAHTIERFNRRWHAFLRTIDLTHANDMRDKYNRYYVIEKECVVRSPKLARHGFTPLSPLTVADLEVAFPFLPPLS